MKTCSKCNQSKSVKSFSKEKTGAGGIRSSCKDCDANRVKEYTRTKKGIVTKIYSAQKNVSKNREMSMPTYSKGELKEWLFSQSLFHELYDNWKQSGYSKDLIPSVDRKDDYKGYSISNIQLMTWRENNRKGQDDRLNGINNKANKIVFMFTMNNVFIEEFHSIHEASRQTNIPMQSISSCCNNNRGYTKGYKFKFKRDI